MLPHGGQGDDAHREGQVASTNATPAHHQHDEASGHHQHPSTSHGHGHGHGHNGHAEEGETDDGISYHLMPDGTVLHSHDGMKPHSHEPIPNAGSFHGRRKPLKRTYEERGFTVGIGGPVGTGKTALMLALCKYFKTDYSIAAVTNDIFTKEDGEFLTRHEALPAERIRAVETGGCPHAAIREDISVNLTELEDLSNKFNPDFLLIESGGDNLAANFSRELADYIIYIIDVCGGDKIPRKGGPGITQADLLVINKTELAIAVGADINVMGQDAKKMRESGPFVFAQVKNGVGIGDIASHILNAWTEATGKEQVPATKKQKTETTGGRVDP